MSLWNDGVIRTVQFWIYHSTNDKTHLIRVQPLAALSSSEEGEHVIDESDEEKP